MAKIRLVGAKAWKEDAEKEDLGLVKTWLPDIERVSEDEAKAASAENPDRVLRFTISTGGVDRDMDTVSVAGWKLDNYKRNPVVLWAHDYSELPIAKSLSVRRKEDTLVSMAEFAPADLSAKADTVFRMLKGGYLRATSVGFIPIEYKQVEDAARQYGYDFTKQELIEFSVVPVPSNPAALIDAHAAGINTASLKSWVEKELDMKEPLHGLSRTDLEDAWAALSSRVIVIDLKDPFTPLPDPIAPPPEPIVDPPPIIHPLDLKVGSCPECSEPITLALPVDGAEMQHRCACGATWTVKSVETLDVSDYRDDVIELAEEPALDFSPEAIEGAVARMAADIRSKLSL